MTASLMISEEFVTLRLCDFPPSPLSSGVGQVHYYIPVPINYNII